MGVQDPWEGIGADGGGDHMTTYRVVVTLVIGAVVLTLLAIWVLSAARRSPTGAPRWVALGASFTVTAGQPSWVSAVRPSVREIEGIDLTSPGAGVAAVVAAQLGPALAAHPSVAVIWVGTDDLLRGRPLGHFLADMRHVIERLRSAGSAVVLVGLPDLRWEQTGGSGRRPDKALRPRLTEWRSGLDELARATGVDLLTPRHPFPLTVTRRGDRVDLAESDRMAFGAIVTRAVERALASGSAVVAPDAADPEDPVVRRRLGLPPIR